jgi:hypothetical protein
MSMPFGKREAVRDLVRRAVRCRERDDPRRERLARREVEAAAVDVRVAAGADDQLISRGRTRGGREVGVRDQRAVGFLPEELAVSGRDDY